MDYGIHPPTVYFPLVVPEALMIEPTETEPKERLDGFVEAMRRIANEAASEPELLHDAPHGRPVRRLDEVRAVKQPVVRYLFEEHAGTRGGRVTTASSVVAEELVALSQELVRAVQEHDISRLDALLAEEFSLDGAAGTLARDELMEAATGAYAIEDFGYQEIDPQVYGNTAVVVSRYRQTASLGGRDASAELRITDVWVRRDGRWQIVRRHATAER